MMLDSWERSSPRPLPASRGGPSVLLELIDLIVERLEADAQLLRGRRLVAVVLLEDELDVLHLDVAERRSPLGDLEMGAGDRRGETRAGGGAARGDGGRQVFGADRAAA